MIDYNLCLILFQCESILGSYIGLISLVSHIIKSYRYIDRGVGARCNKNKVNNVAIKRLVVKIHSCIKRVYLNSILSVFKACSVIKMNKNVIIVMNINMNLRPPYFRLS